MNWGLPRASLASPGHTEAADQRLCTVLAGFQLLQLPEVQAPTVMGPLGLLTGSLGEGSGRGKWSEEGGGLKVREGPEGGEAGEVYRAEGGQEEGIEEPVGSSKGGAGWGGWEPS